MRHYALIIPNENEGKRKGKKKKNKVLEHHTALSAENSTRNTSSHCFNGNRCSGHLAISGIWGI
jgi:hypothetical protein